MATPIGHLQDMTPRAVEILRKVDYIAAEDTRHSKPLLQHFLINTPLLSLHEHNERERTHELLTRLQQGQSVALISDAGTPLISDPGYFLVRETRKQGIKIVPVPGACAVIAALSVAGLATDRFIFEGFLPAKSKARLQHLMLLQAEPRTLIFYETPHRIVETLQDMETVFGSSRWAVIARELTKMYETIHHASLKELVAWVEQDENQQRGELVVLVEGAQPAADLTKEIAADHVLKILLAELPLKQAVELAAKLTNSRKNDLYQRALQIKEK